MSETNIDAFSDRTGYRMKHLMRLLKKMCVYKYKTDIK